TGSMVAPSVLKAAGFLESLFVRCYPKESRYSFDRNILEEIEMNSGLLILRVVLGLVLAAHGAQKLFGWFGGYGIAGTGGFFESIGFRPGRLFAAAAGSGEFAGGLLVALGFLGPIGPALMLSVMIVAAVSVHWGHLFATNNGIEVPLLYGTAATA